jgi:hypothetical protein
MATAKSYASRIPIIVLAVLTGQVVQALLPRQPAVVVNDLSQLAAGGYAAVSGAYFAVKSRSWERRWRIFAAIGMTGWSIGQCIWSWYQIVERTETPSPSWADAGYLTVAPFALAALIVFARHGSSPQANPPDGVPSGGTAAAIRNRRFQGAGLILDGLLIVGSLFLLTWTTTLGATVRATAPNPFALAIAISYPVTDLTLVAIVFLIYASRSISREYLRQLSLLGLGLIGLSLSDSIFSYLVSSGAGELPLICDIGFIVGPIFIALAAAMRPKGTFRAAAHSAPRTNQWMSLVAPYIPLVLATALLSAAVGAGRDLDRIEVLAAVVIFGLVLLRQGLSLLSNLRRQDGTDRDTQVGLADAMAVTIEQAIPSAARTLEDEILEASRSLTSSFERLRQLGRRAEEFEDRVKLLISQAEEARSVAALNDSDAQRFRRMLSSEVGRQLDPHIVGLRRSGNRVAVWTFVGGVILGTLGNVVVAVLMS